MNNNDFDVQNTNEKEEEIEPVKLTKKATTAICIILVVFLIIVLICFRGCSITKKVENPSNPTDTVTTVQENNSSIATNGGDSSEKIEEKTSDSKDTESSSSKKSNSSEKEEVDKEVVVPEKNSEVPSKTETKAEVNESTTFSNLKEVGEPVLNDVINATGLISSKQVYQLEDTYVYGVKIITLQGEENVICRYFCPKKTWDALNMGDSVNISYQMDSLGNTSVISISK